MPVSASTDVPTYASPEAERGGQAFGNLLSGTLLAKVTVIQSGQGLLSFK
jgi:hypothetical protein